MAQRKVILSADSTCDLGEELKARYDVHYYPFHIILEGQQYQDNVDIHVQEIYQAYYDRKALPATAAINVAEYVEYFRPWVDQGYDVIHFCLGGALSKRPEKLRPGRPGAGRPCVPHRQLQPFHGHRPADHRAGGPHPGGNVRGGDRRGHEGDCPPLPRQLHPGHPGVYEGRGPVLQCGGLWGQTCCPSSPALRWTTPTAPCMWARSTGAP